MIKRLRKVFDKFFIRVLESLGIISKNKAAILETAVEFNLTEKQTIDIIKKPKRKNKDQFGIRYFKK